MDFSSLDRNRFSDQLTNSSFDLLVIGGGITGAGIALDASARGLKVALVDMQDFSAGTSSRSTKLIHGGLRYLKQLDLKLVTEVAREREIIHTIAPHLVKPEPMLLPILKYGSLGKFSSIVGMRLYEWLAKVKKEERHVVLQRNEVMSKEPLLSRSILKAGILFYEYRTDDSRLTLEVIKEAVRRGVTAVNYMQATEFTYDKGKINGARLKDHITGNELQIKARSVVNAGGPWVDTLDHLDQRTSQSKLQITKGVHIVVDHKKLPIQQSIYFEVKDKRMIFAIPREGKTYIGTTDTFYSGDPKEPEITNADVTYLLNCVTDFFPIKTLMISDIESSWAGLRPLVSKGGKKPSEISRKDELFVSTSGMITIAGGKLTGYRKMAEKVVDMIMKTPKISETHKFKKCSTDKIFLGERISEFTSFTENKISEGRSLGLSPHEVKTLIARFGKAVEKIFGLARELEKEIDPLPLIIRAQLIYTIRNEMCLSPSDFFIRRTGMLYFDINNVKKWKDEVIRYMQKILSWNNETLQHYSDELNKAIIKAQLENIR